MKTHSLNLNGFEIAVIGMSGRFPGAKNINEYLNNLKNGEYGIKFYTEEELRENGVPEDTIRAPNFVRASAVIPDHDKFDHKFWNYTPHLAKIMSVEHKVALEEVWSAFENAGYDVTKYKKKIGVFFSSGLVNEAFNEYRNTTNPFELLLASGADFLSTRLAYELSLTGPALNIQTACSSSLVAIHYACQSLINGECSMAVAGGITIDPLRMGYFYEEGMIHSKDGYCRSFDNESTGAVFSGGCGCVILKPLENALNDADRIDAIIKGSAVNNDGRRKIGFTAPSEEGQFKVITQAINISEVDAKDIGYIECHGSGTKLGDAIEIQALTRALQECDKGSRDAQCLIGSVKSNMGHAQAAAGVAGFIKAVLSIKNALIFPSLNYNNPSPKIDYQQSPLTVNTKLLNWAPKNNALRVAGVSSFGAGGTNAHMILSEMPGPVIQKNKTPYPYNIISLSAKSSKSLEMMRSELANFLKKGSQENLGDIANMLHKSRAAFQYRHILVCPSNEEAIKKLESSINDELIDKKDYSVLKNEQAPTIVFLCSGIGEHYFNMSKELYDTIPYYREQVDTCRDLLKPYLEIDLLHVMFGDSFHDESDSLLKKTEYMTSAVFTVGYATAKLLMHWGVDPQVLIGHSTGEYLAACLANVLPLKDMLHLVVKRAQIMDGLPSGAMIVVPLTEEEVRPYLNEDISIAATNAPSFCTLSGKVEPIKNLVDKLLDLEIDSKYLPVKHAYHSKTMELGKEQFLKLFSQFKFQAPTIPFVSNLTGKFITDREAVDPCYWYKHTCGSVHFSKGIQSLFDEDSIYIEIGPGNNLVSALLQHQSKEIDLRNRAFNTIRGKNKDQSDLEYFFKTIGKLWLCGVEINWNQFYNYDLLSKLELPTYPFEKNEYLQTQTKVPVVPASKQTEKLLIDEWFYVPFWKKSQLSSGRMEMVNKKILVFTDNCGVADVLINSLQSHNEVYKVRLGTSYGYDEENKEYKIVATVRSDYEKIFTDLSTKGIIVDHIIYLWLLENNDEQNVHEVTEESIQYYQDLGFYSVLFLIQAIGLSAVGNRTHLTVVGNGIYSVTGKENLFPEKATMQGLIKCIPQEYSNITSEYIDVDLLESNQQELTEFILAECLNNSNENQLIAYRNLDRYILEYNNVKLPESQGISDNLKHEGAYLITGGLGGLGFIFAEYLAKNLKANLILTYQAALPARASWEDYLLKPDSDINTVEKIRRILKLENFGIRVFTIQADVCNYAEMQQVKFFTGENFSRLSGIIHCAGITAGQFIINKNKEYSDNIFGPKLQGSLNLFKIFGSEDIDFILFTSSIIAVDCFMGQSDYSAANAFLDAFMYYCNKSDVRRGNKPKFLTVNWDGWQEIGAAEREQGSTLKQKLEAQNFKVKSINDYLFKTQITDSNCQAYYYISKFSPFEHWFLGEHKLGGVPTIPGTFYIELLKAASIFSGSKKPIYIEELMFVSPLRVGLKKSKEVFTVLNKVDTGLEAKVFTASDDSMGRKIWHEHVSGKIAYFEQGSLANRSEEIKKYINHLKSKCKEDWGYLTLINSLVQRNIDEENQVSKWGDRWNCIKQVSTGEDCGILWLSLPESFSNDSKIFELHPALLDIATSAIARKFSDGGNYLPSSYHGITIFSPLPQEVISYVEMINVDTHNESLNCKVVIADTAGNILVEIQKFTMAAIGSDSTTNKVAQFQTRNLDFIFGDNKLKNGLTPFEGLEAFKRIIQGDFRHVMVSTINLEERIKKEIEIESPKENFDEIPNRLSSPSKIIHHIWSNLFGYDEIGEDENFFEVGGNSLLAITLRNQINRQLNVKIGVVDIFAYPTIKKLSAHLFGEQTLSEKNYEKQPLTNDEAIAVIGYSGIFPGSEDIEAYWSNIINGKECLLHLSRDACVGLRVPASELNDKDYIASGALFSDIEKFDAQFWKLSPQDASVMDPQTRYFLEHTWKALEHSGYIRQRSKLAVGIFCGSGWSQYLVKNLFANQAILNKATAFELNTLGDKDFLATQLAYTLDLHGPVMNIDTACSTSLVAIAEACNKLQSMKCDLAIAGGVNLHSSDQFGYCYKEGSIYSKDGYCRVFDSEANGTVISGGVGVVVLKRLSQAKRDNDNILAVIKGYGINNDGRRKVGFTAPSMLGQKDCILESQRCAGISSDDISYVECHGTGTLIGDPIEVQALAEVFRENRDGHRVAKCILGSVKANIGHANKAAGVASFIKVCEMLKRKIIPPSINFVNPNPELKLGDSPFEIITEQKFWDIPEGKRRIAGVSSFGIGGTNAHVIIEEAPSREASSDSEDTFKLLCLSAKSKDSLHGIQEKLREYLLKNSEVNLADFAYTLQVGRESLSHKCLIVCKKVEEALRAFAGEDEAEKFFEVSDTKSRSLIFMFSGQGTQYVNMGKQLYINSEIFRTTVDACARILQLHSGYDFRDILYPEKITNKEAEAKLNNTRFTQAILFVFEYALCKLWESLGIKPAGLIGHSLGEYVAACISGIFSLEDALKLVDARGRLIAELPPGAMLAVGRSYDSIEQEVPPDVSLAAVNTVNACVLSGPSEVIVKLAKQFKDQGVFCHILQTSHAFHSAMMEPMLSGFEEILEEVTFNEPSVPLISNITGKWLKPKEAQCKEYWLRHIRETVNFNGGLTELFKNKDAILLEIGPGNTLANLALQHTDKDKSHKILSSLPATRDAENSEKHFFVSLGKLWLNGYELNFESLYPKSEHRNKIALPTYVFEKHAHWIEPDQIPTVQSVPQQQVKTPIDEWFYVPSWKRLPFDNIQTKLVDKKILIFRDNFGIGDKLISILQSQNEIYKVNFGATYGFNPQNKEYQITATHKSDYEKLFTDLGSKQIFPDHVIHLWLLEAYDEQGARAITEESIARYQDLGFFSVLFLVQAISLFQISNPVNLTVIGSGVYSVTGQESLIPEKATIQGLVKCIPQEYSNITSKYIDIELKECYERLAHHIVDEIPQCKNSIIAFRNQYKWLENYENIPLPEVNLTSIPLKEGGTYLITGAFGGIGSIFAEFLARNFHANLILIGRSVLPDRNQWQEYLLKFEETDTSKKIRTVLNLENLGATVYPIPADVSSYEDMQEVKAFAKKNFDNMNGVFHCAGVSSGKFLNQNDRDRIKEIFLPKLSGALNLYKIFHEDNLDILIFFSSTLSIRCIMGQADYAGANAFMDCFSHFVNKNNVISVNWDVWHNIGMSEKNIEDPEVGIRPHEGIEAFKRLLSKKTAAQVVVSTISNLLDVRDLKTNKLDKDKREVLNDITLQSSKEKLEQQIIEIWCDILGHNEINLNDNFFNLGGNSLKIVKMKEKIDAIISSDLKVTDYFNYSTINLLVQKLTEGHLPAAPLQQNKQIEVRKERVNTLNMLHIRRRK